MNYNNKKFRVVRNTENGETVQDMIFVYRQSGNILTSDYSGGQIKKGQLIGVVDNEGNIDMRYHQINAHDELMTGTCYSKPEIMNNGKIRLHEKWKWNSGDQSAGESILEEI